MELSKFDDLLAISPSIIFPFALSDKDIEFSDTLYCQEMVNQGKLDSFECCADIGSEDSSQFEKQTLFYKKNNSLARRMVYIFRLPDFSMNLSFKHGAECIYSGKIIKVSKKITKEDARQEAVDFVKNIFNRYVEFVRRWIAKDYVSYEDCFSIIKHYHENDGMITIPLFMEVSFNANLNNKSILLPNSIMGISTTDIKNKYTPKVVCLNKNFEYVLCPFCDERNIIETGVVKCCGCGQAFL